MGDRYPMFPVRPAGPLQDWECYRDDQFGYSYAHTWLSTGGPYHCTKCGKEWNASVLPGFTATIQPPPTAIDYRSHAEALAAALEGLIAEQEQYMTDERTDEAIATARAALSAWRSLKEGR